MKFTLSTCALFLILPWKLMCDTTSGQSSTRQNEESTTRADDLTTFSGHDMEQTLEQSDKTAFSSNRSTLLKSTITDHEVTVRAEEPTTFSAKPPEHPKAKDKSYNLSNTELPKRTSKDDEIMIMTDKYTTKEGKNLFSESQPQTSEHQDDTSSSHLSPSNVSTALTQTERVTPQPQDMSKEVITTRVQTFYHFKSTNKVLDRSTGNRTTRSADNRASTSETNIPTLFQKTPEIMTTPSRVKIHTTELGTTEWSSVSQQKETMQPPIRNTTGSNGTLDISNEERNETATYPLNTSTTTVFSNGIGLTVHSEGDESKTTDTMDISTSYEISRTTKGISSEIKSPKSNIETTSMTPTDNFPVKDNNSNKSHPGPVIASLIGGILFLMFVAFVGVILRNRQIRKKKTENTDWAGPSPFIESNIQTNPLAITEDRQFYRQESRKIPLHSFLPRRLSKRLSMLNPTDEEVSHYEDIETSSTFGKEKVNQPNGKATPDQFQTHEAKGSPEVSTDANVPENLSTALTPENNDTQPAPKSEEDILPSPTGKTNFVTSFEDVDLNVSLEKNAESITPSDSLQCPTPPPLPAS